MPYIWVTLLSVGVASGFGLSSALSRAQIQHMSASMGAQNREAELTLKVLTEQADKEHQKALNVTQQLEAANVSTINAINSQRDAFKSKRLYDTHRSGGSCTATKNSNTTSTVNPATNDGELSAEYTEFLKSEAFRADEVSAYAVLCSQFIKGIDHGR
jgi:hypothetical protein